MGIETADNFWRDLAKDAPPKFGLLPFANERTRSACAFGARMSFWTWLVSATMKTHMIWLDTDIGSAIDDALALAFLLGRPDCDLLGISTVTEIESQRARLASVLCRIAKKDVPIYPGARASLLVEAPQQTVPQAAALANYPHRDDFPAPIWDAIDAMRAAIRRNPGQVTLLGIGPLTNIALLFAVDPLVPRLLKQLVTMCGRFDAPDKSCEWNALNDPHATAMVYAAPVEKHLSLGLNATQKVALKSEEFEAKLRQSKFGAPILDMIDACSQTSDVTTFHDPLAAAAIFAPEICQYQRGHVTVETANSALSGFTAWKADASGRHTIATDVDAERFFELYFATI